MGVGAKEVAQAVKERVGEKVGEWKDRGRFGQRVRALGIMVEDEVMDQVYDKIQTAKN